MSKLCVMLAILVVTLTEVAAVNGQDCTLGAAQTSDSARMQCAKDHADYLYQRDCKGQDYCGSKDGAMIGAYVAASKMFDGGWPISSTKDAWLHASLEDRAHLFDAAIATYRHCVELAKRDDPTIGEKCASRLYALRCSVDPAACPPSPRNGPDPDIFKGAIPGPADTSYRVPVQIITSGGGKVFNVKDQDAANLPRADETKPVVVNVTVPTQIQLKALSGAMTAQDKLTIQQQIKVDGVKIQALAGTAANPI